MNRLLTTNRLFAAACLALLAAGPAARPDDAPAQLQGCWKLTTFELNGENQDFRGGNEPRWVIKGDKVFYGGQEAARLAPDPATTPRTIDLKFRDPDRVYEGIYVVEKDTLKICLNGRA